MYDNLVRVTKRKGGLGRCTISVPNKYSGPRAAAASWQAPTPAVLSMPPWRHARSLLPSGFEAYMWVRSGKQTAPMPASAVRDCCGTTPPTATAAAAAPFAIDKGIIDDQRCLDASAPVQKLGCHCILTDLWAGVSGSLRSFSHSADFRLPFRGTPALGCIQSQV